MMFFNYPKLAGRVARFTDSQAYSKPRHGFIIQAQQAPGEFATQKPDWLKDLPPKHLFTNAMPVALTLWVGFVEEVFDDGSYYASLRRYPDGQLLQDTLKSDNDHVPRPGDRVARWSWCLLKEKGQAYNKYYVHSMSTPLTQEDILKLKSLFTADEPTL